MNINRILLALFLVSVLFAGFRFKDNNPSDLIDKKAPLLTDISTNVGVSGSDYYKGKVTLLNFMFLGCKPCMVEIPTLNKIYDDVKSDKFQMLSIAAHTKEQVSAFLSDSISIYSDVRKRYKIEAIKFNIVAECASNDTNANPKEIELMCRTITETFHVEGYPTTFLIDQNGYVRKVFVGFSLTGKDSIIEHNMKVEIEKLLR